MHALSTKTLALILVVLALAVAGCTPQGPAPEPTLDQQVIAGTVAAAQTSAVETAMAELTANAPEPTATPLPTETQPPTETPTVALPTNTAVPVIPTNTFVPATALPTITRTPSSYQCEITKLNPPYNAVLEPGTDFDLNVTLENSGTKDWEANSFDFRHTRGTEFQVNTDVIDLPEDIDVDDSVNFVVDMVAPDDEGTYSATWTLAGDGFTACTVTIQIQVEDD